jgi:hypothetical protein
LYVEANTGVFTFLIFSKNSLGLENSTPETPQQEQTQKGEQESVSSSR